MRANMAFGVLLVALAAAGCGGSEEPEKKDPPPMKVEDTVFGDLVGTQDKARDGANAAVEVHREALEQRLEADEGAPPGE
ncbi:MAG: hypothetical protein ACREVI_00010 [Steroidobacteraceae bacterium]